MTTPLEDLTLYVATGADLAMLVPARQGRWEVATTLGGVGVQTVAADPHNPRRLYAGTFDQGLWRSEDGGRSWVPSWEGPPHRRVLSVAVSPSDRAGEIGVVYAGTEPSALFVSRDGGQNWRELAGLRELPSAPTWSFPPRPWTSHVRWIGLSHRDPGLILAGIELGGVMRSPDGGRTWQDHRPGAYRDCHCLAFHALGRVYEAAGGGAAQSDDGGETWQPVDQRLGHRRYVWAVAVDPANQDLAYLAAAPGPGVHGRRTGADAALYRRQPDGSWHLLDARTGLPHPLPALPYALATDPRHPGHVYAGLGDGTLWFSADAGEHWSRLEAQLEHVQALALSERGET